MISTRAARFATLALCATFLAGRPVAATAQEPPLLKRLYGFDPADPAAEAAQPGPIAVMPDGGVVNLMAETAVWLYGHSRLRRFAADGRLLTAWAGTGRHEGRFERPQDVTVTTEGAVWVLDLHRLQRFAADGTLLAVLPWPPDPTSADGAPAGDGAGGRLAAASDGGFAVSAPDGRIWRLDRDGLVVGAWTSAADPSTDTFGPADLAVLPDASVVVVHLGSPFPQGQSQLRRFSPGGKLLDLRRFGPFGDESYVFLDRVAAGPDGSLLTLGDGVVQRRDAAGRLLDAWPVEGMVDGRDIAVAGDGTVFVQRFGDMDGSGTLLRFAADGRLLGAVGALDVTPWTPGDASDAVGAAPGPDGRLFTLRNGFMTNRLSWLTPLGQELPPDLEWPVGNAAEPFGLCLGRFAGPCANRAVALRDGTVWAMDGARERLLRLAADGQILAAATPMDAAGRPVAFYLRRSPLVFVGTADDGLLLAGEEGRYLYRYDADLGLRATYVPQALNDTFLSAAPLHDGGGVAALLTRSAAAGARDVTVEVSDAHGALGASFLVPSRTSSLTQAPDGSLWLFPSTTEGIQRFDLRGEPLPPIRYEMDASLRPRHPDGIAGSAFGPDGRLYTGTEVYGFDDLDAWRVSRFANPWFSEGPTSVAAWSALDCRAGCRDPLAAGDAPRASLIAERVVTVSEGRLLLVHARGDLRLWVDERLVVDQRDRKGAAVDRTIVLTAGRHRLELALSATDDRAELAVALSGGAWAHRAYLPSLGR
ncbi:MAG: hypothetical protein ACH37Z_07290 [Anaerolineae bacterium]|nr:hypothetical protein [Ardenticatenia bacterium]